jgi:hypothetical protein
MLKLKVKICFATCILLVIMNGVVSSENEPEWNEVVSLKTVDPVYGLRGYAREQKSDEKSKSEDEIDTREMESFMAKLFSVAKVRANLEIASLNNDPNFKNKDTESEQKATSSEFDAWRDETDQKLDELIEISGKREQSLQREFKKLRNQLNSTKKELVENNENMKSKLIGELKELRTLLDASRDETFRNFEEKFKNSIERISNSRIYATENLLRNDVVKELNSFTNQRKESDRELEEKLSIAIERLLDDQMREMRKESAEHYHKTESLLQKRELAKLRSDSANSEPSTSQNPGEDGEREMTTSESYMSSVSLNITEDDSENRSEKLNQHEKPERNLTLIQGLTNYWPVKKGVMADVTGNVRTWSRDPRFTTDRFGNENDAVLASNMKGYWLFDGGSYFEKDFTFTAWVKKLNCNWENEFGQYSFNIKYPICWI